MRNHPFLVEHLRAPPRSLPAISADAAARWSTPNALWGPDLKLAAFAGVQGQTAWGCAGSVLPAAWELPRGLSWSQGPAQPALPKRYVPSGDGL
jgi:hypothetical protein